MLVLSNYNYISSWWFWIVIWVVFCLICMVKGGKVFGIVFLWIFCVILFCYDIILFLNVLGFYKIL